MTDTSAHESMSEWTIEIDEPVTVEDWQNVAEGFFVLSRETAKRAEAAEAEVERLTHESLRQRVSLAMLRLIFAYMTPPLKTLAMENQALKARLEKAQDASKRLRKQIEYDQQVAVWGELDAALRGERYGL